MGFPMLLIMAQMKTSTFKLEQDEFGVHQRIIYWVGKNKEVLEVGCASGYMSAELTKKDCTVVGVEINPEEASKAKRYCQKVIIGDIETHSTRKKIGSEKFEVIIMADVLEHLKDPEGTLKNLVQFLEKQGSLIISVPNIGFLTNRLWHLLGRFEYTEWGIMDKTHLRFFTKESILTLVKSSGLEIEKFDYVANFTQLPLYMQTLYPLLKNRKWWRRLEYKITGFWPEGLAVQFLLFCQKG